MTRLRAKKSTDSDTAANIIVSEIVTRLGIPRVIRSDVGTQFANQVIDALCAALHIRYHRILPYQPQSNGVVERVNGENSSTCVACFWTLRGRPSGLR